MNHSISIRFISSKNVWMTTILNYSVSFTKQSTMHCNVFFQVTNGCINTYHLNTSLRAFLKSFTIMPDTHTGIKYVISPVVIYIKMDMLSLIITHLLFLWFCIVKKSINITGKLKKMADFFSKWLKFGKMHRNTAWKQKHSSQWVSNRHGHLYFSAQPELS